ncbi:MAG: FAD-binding oxidoreductase, partial [Woeseiaceae bacterium]|nr:FAD-binding oxidoreductase [Woeseiaceae bacterium]
DGLKTLRKDTAGYDMKQVFIGSEGTLGVITAAALKLFPAPGPLTTALVALAGSQDAVRLLGICRDRLADRMQAFELISARAFDFVTRHLPGKRVPFDVAYPWFVLMDVATPDADDLEATLAGADALLQDAMVAKNDSESAALWRMRHAISESEKREGPGAKHDISVPIGRIGVFLAEAEKRLAAEIPEAQPVVFGHVGDGNLHYNVMLPPGIPAERQVAEKRRISKLVYDLVVEMRGSISAEHGIGQVKRPWLFDYKDPAELALMRTLKTALDPNGILNPGKVI